MSGGVETYVVAARVHGRYLVDRPDGDGPFPLLVGFHGYAETAAHMIEALQRVRGERKWLLASVQAINRFYTKRNEIAANWMTREDRALAIEDNIAYVAAVMARLCREQPLDDRVVYAGFSQGAAMAYRAAAFVADAAGGAVPRASGLIVLAGDVPPDVAPRVSTLPAVLIGRGTEDDWYTAEKAAADLEVFASAGVTPAVHVFDGGHVWHDEFVSEAGRFLDSVAPPHLYP